MKVAIINHCNEWHEYSSFKLIGIVETKDLDKALDKIKKKYKYNDEELNDYVDVEIITIGELDI